MKSRASHGVVKGFGIAVRAVVLFLGTVAITMSLFLVLPLLEQVNRMGRKELEIRSVNTADIPPPPPPPEEPQEEKKEETPPPDLAEDAPPLDLSQLELALNPSFGDGLGDVVARLTSLETATAQADMDAIFSAADLDQMPRPIFQPPPEYPPELRKKRVEGTVYVVFVVDKNGRVTNPVVQSSTTPALEGAALQAVKRWRFEPGRRRGQMVQFKMRVPISFSVS